MRVLRPRAGLMRPHHFDTRGGLPSARYPAAALLLLAGCVLLVLLGAGPAGATIAEQQQRLQEVRSQRATIADQVAAGNQRINALIGQVSDLRVQERTAARRLARTQADLDEANEKLKQGRAHLRRVRAELREAVAELKRILVGVYKSDDPEMIKLLLQSSDWEDASIDATYLQRIHDYQTDTIARVKDLRARVAATVAELEETKERIEDARDSLAARRQSLADSRAALEAREAELTEARRQRQATLSRLAGRAVRLQDDIEASRREQAAAIPPAMPDASNPDVAAPQPQAPAPSGSTATLNADGSATAPADAPAQVKAAIAAANAIRNKPYVWGGGHGSFEASGYDCSGAVSYALHGGGFLSSPLDSTGLSYWGEPGAGNWITVYANSGHAYAVIAGLRWDTSGTGGSGPSWSTTTTSFQSPSAFTARHPAGF